jgi:hypothetical protein
MERILKDGTHRECVATDRQDLRCGILLANQADYTERAGGKAFPVADTSLAGSKYKTKQPSESIA